MNNNYCLNQQELAQSIVFLGFLDFSHASKPLNEIKECWDNEIFNQLLKEQPDLRFEYDYFWSVFESAEFKKDCYANIFKDKIRLENYSAVFKFSKLYIGQQSQRVNLFKSLNFKSDKFIFLMHAFLLKNIPNDDDFIYKTYFELITNKIKVLKNEEILTVIDNYDTGKDLIKLNAKMNGYSLCEKNESLYHRMINNMSSLFAENAVIAHFFQEKMDYYFPEFNKEKEIFKLKYMTRESFFEKENYNYVFELNEQFVFDKTKQSLIDIDEFKILLTTSLYKNLLKLESSIVFNGDIYNSKKLDLTLKTLSQKEKIKFFCFDLVNEFDFKSYPWKSSLCSEKIQYITSAVEKQYFETFLQINKVKEEKKSYFKI